MTSASFYTTGRRQVVRAESVAALVKAHGTAAAMFNPEHGTWWLHCENALPLEIHALSRALRLHDLTTEDIVNGGLPDKFEEFGDYFFVVYRLNDSSSLYLITTQYGVLTVYSGEASLDFETLHSRIDEIGEKLGQKTITPDWITSALIDTVTDSFGPQIFTIEKEASIIERELFLHNGQSDVHVLLRRMCKARDASISLMRLLQGKPSVLNGLLKRQDLASHDEPRGSERLLSSARGHLTEMTESAFSLEAMVARSFVNYVSIMRVKMVHSNTTMEQIAGAVAIVGLVLIPSHVITSAWAMNVPVPGHDKPGGHWFWGVVGIIILTVLACGVAGYFYYLRVTSNQTTSLMREAPKLKED